MLLHPHFCPGRVKLWPALHFSLLHKAVARILFCFVFLPRKIPFHKQVLYFILRMEDECILGGHTHTKDRLSSTTTRHRLLGADSWKLTECRSIRLLGWVDLAGELGVLKSYQIRPVQFENVPPKVSAFECFVPSESRRLESLLRVCLCVYADAPVSVCMFTFSVCACWVVGKPQCLSLRHIHPVFLFVCLIFSRVFLIYIIVLGLNYGHWLQCDQKFSRSLPCQCWESKHMPP